MRRDRPFNGVPVAKSVPRRGANQFDFLFKFPNIRRNRDRRCIRVPRGRRRRGTRCVGDFRALTPRHKVFVSFHHAKDEYYKDLFCRAMGSDIVDKSVEDGDIDTQFKTDTIRGKIRDEFIADATVTVVLVGRCTWQRKHVDWEIGSSLRDTKKNSRCGLLGIWLPTHLDHGRQTYRPRLLPPQVGRQLRQPESLCRDVRLAAALEHNRSPQMDPRGLRTQERSESEQRPAAVRTQPLRSLR